MEAMKMNLSSCGIDCGKCKFKIDKKCPGCGALKGKPFWGRCELYTCAESKNLTNCGECKEFPCKMLKEWASGENPERIQNLIDNNKRNI